jgi:hypothetical protein
MCAPTKEYCWEITVDGLRVIEITTGELLLALDRLEIFCWEFLHRRRIKVRELQN